MSFSMGKSLTDESGASSSSQPYIDKIFVVSVQYSGYKQDAYDPNTYLFKYEKKARTFMRNKAMEFYYDMVDRYELELNDEDENTDKEENSDEEEDSNEKAERKKAQPDTRDRRERTPPEETKNSCGPYWYEGRNSVSFGEDRSMGQCYRRAWGLVTISEEKLNTAKE